MVNGRIGNTVRDKKLFESRHFKTHVVGKMCFQHSQRSVAQVHFHVKYAANCPFSSLSPTRRNQWMGQLVRSSHCSESKLQMKKNGGLMSDIIRCFIAGPVVDGTVLAAPQCI